MLAPFTPASTAIPQDLDASNWENLRPLYDELNARPLKSAADLERLILDRSELDAAVSETGSVLHINMTCHTDDPSVTKAYLDFVEHVQPQLKQASFDLDKKIAGSPLAPQLNAERYRVLLRDTRLGVELFRPENIPIETELAKLEQEFQQVSGAMTVQFRGEEKTMPLMGRYQEETDRATREEAWRAVAERRSTDRDAFDRIYDEMIKLRHQCALNAGFANYRDYMHKAKRRFDYTPEDCHAFAKGVEQHVVPAQRALNEERRRSLGVDKLRPWDLAVDVKGRAPLRPFTDGADLVARSKKLFNRMDPSLGEMFAQLCAGIDGLNCLDLDTRKGKAPGGYQAMRDRKRVPFIFMNAAGVQRDVETMVHEAGHSFHSMLSRQDPLLAYRSEIPLEFAEVASMSMELTSYPFLDEFYTAADAARAKRVHLESVAAILPWIATIDQFQHWVYTHPGHTRDERNDYWVSLLNRFGSAVDWSGIEHYKRSMWHRQLHLFTAPFYYIEYGIAQLGALQMFAAYERNPAAAIAGYKKGLALGGSRPLPELFATAGLEFNLSPDRIKQTWSQVERTLAQLPA